MFASKKKQNTKEERTFIFPNSKVYFEYDMKLTERIAWMLAGFLMGYIVGQVFYDLLVLSVICGVLVGYVMPSVVLKAKISRQMSDINKQFQSLLESLVNSLGAGRTVYDSFQGAKVDMLMQYSEKDYIVKEINNIIDGMNNNIKIEVLLKELGYRSGSADIDSFADVFDTCYSRGGNIKSVLQSTYEIMNDKMEIAREINTMVAASRQEQNMMLVMPVVFVFLLNSMGTDMTGRGTTVGYITTTIALVMFLLAYIIGKKILNIKL
jgi:tight adherence protein B